MNRRSTATVLQNLTLLALVAMPSFFVLVWIQALLTAGTRATDLGDVIETGGFYYLANLLPVLVGGVVHQITWLALSQAWPTAKRRIVALLLAPVIPVTLLLFWGGRVVDLLYFGVPMFVALGVYVLLLKIPDSSEEAVA